MTLRGINIVGSQVFIQVFPKNHRWAELRQKLEDALLHIGEEPISYPNKTPIHMNFMRVIDNGQEQLLGILQAIDDLDLRNIEIGEFPVSAIELLVTDFMVSVKNRRIYKQFDLQ
jgi:hypothetical protein